MVVVVIVVIIITIIVALTFVVTLADVVDTHTVVIINNTNSIVSFLEQYHFNGNDFLKFEPATYVSKASDFVRSCTSQEKSTKKKITVVYWGAAGKSLYFTWRMPRDAGNVAFHCS